MFQSQVSSLKEVTTTQQNDIKSLRAELAEAREKYDQLVVERSTLQARVFDLEASAAFGRGLIVLVDTR